jgi:hypothetical protein
MNNTEIVALINETMAGLSILASELSAKGGIPTGIAPGGVGYVPNPQPRASTPARKTKKKKKRGKAKKQSSEVPNAIEIVKQDAPDPSSAELKSQDSGEWWDDFTQVQALATEKNVVSVPGQPYTHFLARLFAAIGPGPHLEAADAEMRKLVTRYKAEGINPPAPPPARNAPVRR